MGNDKKNKELYSNIDKNLVLSKFESDLQSLKGLENVDINNFRSPKNLEDLNELSNFFINNSNLLNFLKNGVEKEAEFIESGQEVPDNLAILNKKISNLEKNLGLNREDILAVFKSYDEKLLLEAKSEVLQAKKTIKIGKMNMPVSTLIRLPAYAAGTALMSLTSAGLAGVAGVALFRNIEKYISNKNDKKNIEIKAKENRRALDEKYLAYDVASSLYIRKLEKEDKNFKEDFLMNKSEEEKTAVITDFVEVKYGYMDKDVKKSLITKYKVQLYLENNQTKKEADSKIHLPGIVKKFANLIKKDSSDSSESKAIRAIIVSGVIITTGRIAREIPIVKNILGAYLGWNLGGLAAKAVIKKEKPANFNEQNFIEELETVKSLYHEFKLKNLNEDNEENDSIELFDELWKEVERLEKNRAQASIEIEKNSLKDIDPEKYLIIKKSIDEAGNYIHLIKARFRAINSNDKKEEVLMERKKISDTNKTKSNLIKLGGAVIGSLTPSVLNLIIEGVHNDPVNDVAEINNATEASSAEINIKTEPEALSTETEVNIEIESEGNQIEVEDKTEVKNTELNNSDVEKINEITKNSQKSVILESGDGVSKIFNGNMSSNYKVNFIDEQTGEVFEGMAGSKIVHPGDKIVLGEDGEVNVLCKHGVVDNPKFNSDHLIKESDNLEKLATIKRQEIEVPKAVEPESLSKDLSEDLSEGLSEGLSESSTENLTDPSNLEDLEELDIEAINDPNALRMTYDESGKLVLKNSSGEVINKISSVENTDNTLTDFKETETNSIENDEVLTPNNSTAEELDTETINDPNALRMTYDESGKLVLENSSGDIISGKSSAELDKNDFSESVETTSSSLENNDVPVSESLAKPETFSEDIGNLNESFNNPENFKNVLGKDFTNLKIIEKVDSFGNKLGFSLKDPITGNSVDISFPKAGGIRLEEGLNDQNFGKLQENFDKAFTDDKALIIGTEDNGSFSIEDFRNGVREILK